MTFREFHETFERLLTDITIPESDFNSLIKDLVLQTPLGAMQLDNPRFLIRTSLLDENENCTNVSRCSYVPDFKKDIIPLQRCNFKGQQVFYASIPGGMKNFSDGAQPSLIETVMQKLIDDPAFNGRIAAASRWQIRKHPIFWYLPHSKDSINSNENFKFLFYQFDTFLRRNSLSDEGYQNFTKKLNYLSEIFRKNYDKEKTYRITATYYNTVMALFNPFNSSYDALIYPSANTKGEGMNIVLKKEYVKKENIFCDLVVLYKIYRYPDNPKNIWFIPFSQALPDEFGNLSFKPLNENMNG